MFFFQINSVFFRLTMLQLSIYHMVDCDFRQELETITDVIVLQPAVDPHIKFLAENEFPIQELVSVDSLYRPMVNLYDNTQQEKICTILNILACVELNSDKV